jgi:tetraacyldisaccharide 4'-kinase
MTQAARPWLAPLVPIYRLGIALRKQGLRVGLERVRRLQFPVVSIGNLSTGGAGKTPLVIAIARALVARGVQVDVLSRGYGRTGNTAERVDPDGTAERFGDEPLVIAREAEVPVYVAAQRHLAGLLAEKEAGAEHLVHILDDGFQHRQLRRDVDIVLVSGTDLNDRLLPAGNLREPLNAIDRATVLAFTMPEAPILEETLRRRGHWYGPTWHLHRRMQVPAIDGPIVAFCGIARPDQFFAGLEAAGLHVASRIAFADHQRYLQHDIDCILEAARTTKAVALVTTEKDRVRLARFAPSLSAILPLETAGLRIEIENEAAVIDWLVSRTL